MLNTPFTLPCGAVIQNRLVKAAMTERLSGSNCKPNARLVRLYEQWADTNVGLLITGNVMVDRYHLESAGNVVVDNEEALPEMKAWAGAGKKHGNHIWVQICHSGRQTSRFVNLKPKSASGVQLKKLGLFSKPKAMTEKDILDVINGFVKAAVIAKKSGFTGVQIHAAHGYLISQFLSPLTNHRNDQWGGSVENRSRLLRTIIQDVREAVGPEFPVGLKLNSADFQRGGFTEEDSLTVIKMLEPLGVDLLEISGGTYEKLVFFLVNGEDGKKVRESTMKREAYFMEFANRVREVSNIPLMLTGGFRTYDFVEETLKNGEVDMIGMARPFIVNINEIKGFLNGEVKSLIDKAIRTGIHQLEESAEAGFYGRNIVRLAKGKNLKFNFSPIGNSIFIIAGEFRKAMIRRIKRRKKH
ncbi:NADH:flavin oxidoreductase/NADH oxidase family protein [Aquimarina algiphila]|uniref:NADH:flavin oxidoreductase/NADH oxidase family protein n=1 Tax=Aquimarina algiphila TaxID=2047982 RepID=UPI0023305F93|nr:NADH:flavin oxidoreductase/NADH oxidase family protein [Aquimarina algiphila]